LIGAAFGIGFTFGPLLGFAALYLFPEAKGAPGYLAAVISLLAFLLGVAILPETLKQGASGHARGWFALHGLQTALRTPGIGTLVVMFFLSTFSFAMFEPTLALVTSTRALGLDDQHNFLVFTYVGLVLALAQGLLYRRLAARLGEVAFIRIGGLLMALGLAGIGIIAMLAEQSET